MIHYQFIILLFRANGGDSASTATIILFVAGVLIAVIVVGTVRILMKVKKTRPHELARVRVSYSVLHV